jgi:hypothetical protein
VTVFCLRPALRAAFAWGGPAQTLFFHIKEMLIKSRFVIPAQAGIQENQQAGHRPAPV